MPLRLFPGLLTLVLLTGPGRADDPKPGEVKPVEAPGPFATQAAPFLAKYCVECHGAAKPKADLNLLAYTDDESVLRGRKLWVRLKEYVEAGEMPPEGSKQPADDEAEAFGRWIDATLARVNCASQGNPGKVTIRRLNRAEYNNTIRDLVGIDFRPADDFPSDDVGYGFDNIGDVLTMPPVLFEKYLEAAETISTRAIVAGPTLGPVRSYDAAHLPADAGGNPSEGGARVLASQGAITFRHDFPRDAEYLLRVRAYGQQAGPEPVRIALTVDGRTVLETQVKAVAAEPGVYECRTRLEKGSRPVAVAFLNDYYDEKNPDPNQRDRNLFVLGLEVQGPVPDPNNPTLLPESHRRIVFKTPTKDNEREVAGEILERFASRAYRRPVTPGEVARLAKLVELAESAGDPFERGVQLAVQAVLVSPQFLFRVELDHVPPRKKKDKTKPPETYAINEFELASRLSYFLWSSTPDDELFGLALAGKLRAEGNLEKQVRRMLRDPKARALVENFADQWLQVRNLKTVNPDPALFPAFDEPLRQAMLRETELFFESVVRDDRSILDLLDSRDTFLNERLAKHYGVAGVRGDEFRKVALPDGRRGGILTQASVLTVTSNPTRTSPVKRGKWILEQILGTPPPPPPPNVPELADGKGKVSGTLRQRMEQHRANPSCASCHARMDPLGFGFENFDAIGAWRDRDGDAPIDPSGLLPSGQSFQGPEALKSILKGRDRDFAHCLAEKLLTYALGRGIEYYDVCAVDRIVEATAKDGFRASTLVLEIVRSDPFQKRNVKGNAR